MLAGRGLDDAAVRLEKLRLAVDEDPSTANVARFSRAEDAFASAGGYAAESDARRVVDDVLFSFPADTQVEPGQPHLESVDRLYVALTRRRHGQLHRSSRQSPLEVAALGRQHLEKLLAARAGAKGVIGVGPDLGQPAHLPGHDQ